MNTNLLEQPPSTPAAPPSATNAQEEQQLVRSAKTGNLEAYDELVRRYQ